MSESVHVPADKQYLRTQQVNDLEGERKRIDDQLRDPSGQQDRGLAMKRRRTIEQMLSTQQPPDLNPQERDAWSKRAKSLEEKFTRGMPSGEEMRKNPPGAIGKHMRWERENKQAIVEWKNIQRALHKGTDDPDVANIERFRPHRTPADLSMEGAQIPGTTYIGTNPSPAYLENYDRVFGAPEPEPESAPKRVAMACGAMKAPQGRRIHEKNCKACREVLSGGGDELPPAA